MPDQEALLQTELVSQKRRNLHMHKVAAGRLLEHLGRIEVDGLHHESRALIDRAHKDPRDKPWTAGQGVRTCSPSKSN